ncbi:hypothetical protein D3C85_983020 [compost metagenome]
MGARAVLGPDRRGQAVGQAVGQLDGFFLAVERTDVAARAEDFLGDHRRVVGQAGPDGRLHPGAAGQVRRHLRHAAAGDHGGTVVHRLLVVGEHLLAVLVADQGAEVGGRVVRLADLQAFCAGLQAGDELVEDRPLDVHALGAQAHLAAVGEGRAQGALDGLVHVAVGEHDAGVLAAQLQRHLAHALGGGAHDGLAGAGLAGEGDGVDVRVGGEEGAGRVAAEAVHHVVHAGRHAGGVHHLAEQGGGGGGFLGRLDHHGVAAGQRRADLPGHQQQRQVPRADHADHALGAAHAVVERAGAVRGGHLEGFGGHVLDQVGEHREVGRAARDVDVAGQRLRLAGVQALGLEELVEARGDAGGDAMEDLGALGDGHLAPRALQRGARGLDRGVDLGFAGLVDLGDHLAVGRVDVVEQLAAGGTDVFAVDEVFDLFHVHALVEGNQVRTVRKRSLSWRSW